MGIPNEVTTNDDVIDSRDITARIDYLETIDPDDRDDDERHEYAILTELRDEAGGASDWSFGETLIRDSYFEDYAKQLADDIGAISGEARWPATHINWTAAADELRMDYTEVQFSGVTYWIRW